MFRCRALTDCSFENASAECGLFRLDSLSACSSVFTEARVRIEPEASSCEIRELRGYGTTAHGGKAVVRQAHNLMVIVSNPIRDLNLPSVNMRL